MDDDDVTRVRARVVVVARHRGDDVMMIMAARGCRRMTLRCIALRYVALRCTPGRRGDGLGRRRQRRVVGVQKAPAHHRQQADGRQDVCRDAPRRRQGQIHLPFHCIPLQCK